MTRNPRETVFVAEWWPWVDDMAGGSAPVSFPLIGAEVIDQATGETCRRYFPLGVVAYIEVLP